MASKVSLSRLMRPFIIGVRFLAILPGLLSLICPLHLLAAAEDCCGGDAVEDEAPPPAATEFFKTLESLGLSVACSPGGGATSRR